jgi:hypothetical protein
MDARVKAIVAHFTLIGWVIALIANTNNKEEFTSFYLRQTLGIHLAAIFVSWIPVVGWLLGIITFAFWVLSFVYTLQGVTKTIPFGEYLQDWFRSF